MRAKISACIGRLRDMQLHLQRILHERHYDAPSCTLKYICETHPKSDSLIVVFSGCTGAGVPARYNYMRTLRDIPCNKLFILDDYGLDRRGGYYLGEYPDFHFEQATTALIRDTIKRTHVKHCYFAGSSKGGWAGLLFGIKLDLPVEKHVIIGAPQYLLGQYLYHPANRITFDGICMQNNESDVVAALDHYLQNVIHAGSTAANKPDVYLHYSDKEQTYQEHIAFLIEDLKQNGYQLIEDVADYEDHDEVSSFYPAFLLDSLKKSMSDCSKVR